MRLFSRIAFALFLAAPLPLTAYAAEPESPDALIGQTDAVRAAIQERLSAKFTNASEARKSEQGALVEYYSIAENRLLWVDDHGLNDRAKSVMEEIGKADEYGLRPADYPLPKAGEENPDVKWLADAEIKISFAVLSYARDARGGRIDPQRISPNLDPTLILPDPLELIESIAFRSDPASYLRSFQPDQPQFEALRQALIVARGGNPDKDIVRIPDGPTLELGVDHEQVAVLRKRLNIPVEDGGKETVFDASVHAAVQRFQEEHGVLPDGAVGAGTRRL
ncbi:MAG TPA: peptidoglycan-binding protein, partial [Methyloceanibacter sp.]